MFGENQHHVSDASVKTQTRSRILTPASDNFLDLSDEGRSGGKKRKRDGNTMDDLLKDPFVVRPYPSKSSIKSRTFQPLILLPRSRLPLSALDVASSAKALPHSRLFEAHVKILELEDRMGTQPMVLIARLNDSLTLFAVERESRGLYVLCQLGSWINLQQLRAAAVASVQDMIKASSLFPADEAQVPLITPEASKYSKKKRLAIEALQSKVKRPSNSLVTESSAVEPESPFASQLPGSQLPDSQTLEMPVGPPIEEVPSQPTAGEIFENVRNQYLEALYLSKASLAYFAKGPLSRARAAFHLDLDSTLDMNDYITFLESLIIPTNLIDKKYREAVPNFVSLIDIHDQSAEDGPTTAKPKRRKTAKKIKLGKNGLYPTEDPLIRQWWANYNDDIEFGGPGISKEELTKNRISQLRIRETQLQMIIILEVLALQPLATAPENAGLGLPAALPTIETVELKDKAARARKPDHLTMLVDVHIDRLCIWQSVALESIKLPEKSDKILIGSKEQSKHTDNILRDFCIEVIAPFFSSRLPDRCAQINRKLGGPVVVSPPKPKTAKSANLSGAPSRPGAATKRPVPVKPCERKSLQRVLTDDRERRSMSRGPNRAISLMRSATMPVGLGLKREASEAPSLSSIPTADSQLFAGSRGGILNSKRFAQREVDMSSLVPEMNPKAKKQANIEAELRDAISALKKPNRELAGKAIAETAEKRSASASHSRKSKKPVRNPLFQGVQITATPKTNRQKNMQLELELPASATTVLSAESSFVPASSMLSIPQSAIRSSRSVLPGRNPLLASVQETPTRKFASSQSRQIGERDVGGCPPSSPFHIRRSSAQLFSAVTESATKKIPTAFTSHGIQESPIKMRFEDKLEHSHPAVPKYDSDKENERKIMIAPAVQNKEVPVMAEQSIYKSLGWDDGDDIDNLA